MAKKKDDRVSEEKDLDSEPETFSREPGSDDEGWEDVSIEGAQNWHVCEPGNVVAGQLLSRNYRRPSKNNPDGKYFYRIRVMSPTKVVRKEEKNEKAIERLAQKNEIVCVDERKDLEDLAMLCDDGGKYLVRLEPIEKVAIGRRSFWRFGKRKKVLSPPTRTPRPVFQRGGGGGDDDTPF